MSNILRRPMFRGGRVESRGTGITSGLGYARGGRIGLYRGGRASYNPNIPAPVTGGQILGRQSAVSPVGTYSFGELFKPVTISPTGEFSPYNPKSSTKLGLENLENYPPVVVDDSLTIEEDPILNQAKQKVLSAIQDNNITTDIEVEPSGLLDSEGNLTKKGKDQTKQVIVSNSGDGDASTVDENDLENMISRYEELLGSKKARQRDAGDMLARASAAFLKPPARGEKRGITEALGDFMTAEAASGPSRTEKISQAAGMLGIKGEQAKDLYSLKQAADKKYSPSITQKKIQYIRSLPKDSPEYVLALRTEKLSSTLASESKTRSMAGDTMSAAEVNSYGPIYYDDWKGQFIPGQSKQDGTYLNIKEKKIITFKNGELVSTVDIKI
jgi:hypothetical protein